MSIFYEKFERHSHGEGLKGRSTHYCPGCGHGIVHRELAESLEALGVQDRTVLISPVGCSVFAYYYFDVGNSQAAHGRAPVVALGHKLANPESIVISYQGDGDLASIGLAETIATAQMGIPITVIFINNAIYGMTGGQLAPTSLMGQKTSTSPEGRSQTMGQPLKMAELIAQLDGPVYVERVALFNPRERVKARRAIEKALRLQKEGRGYAFIEVLAECPTHLKRSPEETEAWVEKEMAAIFPLGIKKDLSIEPWFHPRTPSFEVDEVLHLIGGESRESEVPLSRLPENLRTRDISFKLAGSGGDGAQTAALLLARAAIDAGLDATHIPSYGPESRGGTSYADVHLAEGEVLNPAAPDPHVLIAFNAPSRSKFAPTVREGGTILYDSTVVPEPAADLALGRRFVPVPFTQLARDLGKPMVKNVIALGALQCVTEVLDANRMLTTLRHVLKDKPDLIHLNEAAFVMGRRHARPVHS